MSVGYLGPEGSYSHLAATLMCKGCDLKAYQSFYKIFSALSCGECDGAVIPIENTLNGGIMQNLDLLQSSDGIVAVRGRAVAIDHRLATLSGSDIKNIRRVYSHKQALEQCAEYLSKVLPYATQIETLSTAASLDMVRSEQDACIVGSHIRREGIILSPECISDEKKNFTRFLYIQKGGIADSTRSQKVFFSVTCKNASGGLMSLIQPIAAHGRNMTRLQSRPIKDKPDEYRFFIETDGDYSSRNVKSMLSEVKAASSGFKLLGCY